MARRERCWNDNHGRATVTVRFCPNCGEIVNRKIPARTCSEENHAKRRRARDSYCLDCGERLIQER
jgi:rRNA maturation protein Nop10